MPSGYKTRICEHCGVTTGNTKAMHLAHKVPEDCIRVLTGEVALRRRSIGSMEEFLRELKRLEDTGATEFPRRPLEWAPHGR
jgi:hypothetical protein